jgi:hypothetical protein
MFNTDLDWLWLIFEILGLSLNLTTPTRHNKLLNLSKKHQTRLTFTQKYVIIKTTRGTPLRLSLRKPLALNNM